MVSDEILYSQIPFWVGSILVEANTYWCAVNCTEDNEKVDTVPIYSLDK